MKLKKIASLALAGLMAVSMLAGCNNGSSSSSSSEGSNVVVTGAADAMNALQDVVDFKDSTTLEAWLATATKKANYTDVNGANKTNPTLVTTNNDVYKTLEQAITPDYTLTTTVKFDKTGVATNDSTTKLYLYVIDDLVSEESVLNTLSKSLCTATNYPDYVNVTNDNTTAKGYKATYTGEVSIAKVSKENEEGKTASAYYILVSVTQAVAKDATVLTKN